MTSHAVPSGLSASRVREGPKIARLSIWLATSLRWGDKRARRSVRDQSPAVTRRIRFEEHKSADEGSTDAEEEQASEVHAIDPVHAFGRPQVIHLSSQLSEYLRPTDKLRAKVDSNLTMAISLDDPSLEIVHEIRGGWDGLVLFMFGWVNGIVFMMAIVLFGAVVMSPAGDSLGHLAADTQMQCYSYIHLLILRLYPLCLPPTAAHMELVGSSDLGSPSWSRQHSAFLRSYPWDDTVLLVGAARDLEKNFQAQEGDSAMVDPALRSNLPSHAHSHGASGTEAQSVQHFIQAHERMIQQLILSKAATTGFVECPEPNAILRAHKVAKGTQASNLLCRYIALLRVVDIASVLEGRQRGARISKWPHWRPAENPAHHALKTLATPPDGANRAEEFLATNPLDTSHRIMKELAHSMTKSKGCQIVSNILLASLHLSWLFSGNIDIPDTFSQAAVPSAAPTAAQEGAKSSNVDVDMPQSFSQGIVDLA
ncbi:hypothetical protein BKA70DRAFT_1237485, partial [Coprinopsis sp. MPI-PUGE-AT-0042]